MANIELHVRTADYPSTSYPERERILEVRFAPSEGNALPTFATVDLVGGKLPDDIDGELRWEIRRLMGNRMAKRYDGYDDVTDELGDE